MSKHIRIILIFLALTSVTNTWAGRVRNSLPTVSLTSPVNGSSFAAPATIVLTATAADADGTILRVNFYQGTVLIGTDSVAPYSLTWSNAPGGTYSLSAIATDNLGASTTSTVAGITVTGAKVIITAPANGATLYGGATTVTGTFNGDASTTILVDNGNSTRLAKLINNTYSATLPIFLGPNTLTVSVARIDKTSDKAIITVTGNDYPKIAFRAPAKAAFDAPTNLLFAVDAVSPASAISKVEFYKNGTLASTVNSPPYQYTLANALAQSYTIQAKAIDSFGYASYASTTVTGVGPNALPTAIMTAPLNGANYTAPANITLIANASDPDGSIALVEFFQNGVLLGGTNFSPYRFNWLNVPTGLYTLTAKATDNRNGTATTAPVNISVTPPNAPPAASLTSPAAGASFYAPASIVLSANASDSDGTVTKVEFYQGTTLLGAASSAPYTYVWAGVAAGSYTLSAKATDNFGSVTTSTPVTVTVIPNAPPTVGLTSPVTGFTAFAPANVTLSANAADSDGSVTQVDFYQGTTLIGTATAAPYTFNWATVAAGTYSLTAKAIDNLGAVTTSASLTITVNTPSVAFTAPSNGVTVSSNSVLVSGTILAPANSGITVNGMVASIDADNHFYANNVPLVAGSNILTATLTTPAGQTASQSITITSNAVPPAIQISPDRFEGIAPLTVNFNFAGVNISSLNISVAGQVSIVSGINSMAVTYPAAGAYPTTLTYTDSMGATITQSYVIVAHDAAQVDLQFKALWSGMSNALVAGDKAAALAYLSGSAQVKYGPVFDALAPDFAQIMLTWSPPLKANLSSSIGEYGVVTTNAGVRQLFLIYFVKGTDGVWRLDGM